MIIKQGGLVYSYTVLHTLATGTFGTAAWKRKSFMGNEVEFVAVRVIAVTTGLLGLRSKENTTLRPFFSKAVMLGIPAARVSTIVL